MSGRITTPFERALTTTVNDIEHIEADSYTGLGVIKIFFHPSVDVNMANAQVTAIAQTMLRQLPAGDLDSAMLRVAPSEPEERVGLVDELDAATEAMKRVPWTTLEQLKGDADVLRRIDEAEALLKTLRKTLTS